MEETMCLFNLVYLLDMKFHIVSDLMENRTIDECKYWYYEVCSIINYY